MKQTYEPNFNIPAWAAAPDFFHESAAERPRDDFVVSRHRNGAIASTYGDKIWNLSAYHPEEKPSSLNFEFWGSSEITVERKKLIDDSRQIIFLLMWLRNGPSMRSTILYLLN